MATRKHVHTEVFPVTPEQLFALLHTPLAIQSWWQAARASVEPRAGGTFSVIWGADVDDPDYDTEATILAFDPPRRMVLGDYRYRAKSGPLPFEAKFVTEFAVAPHPQGASLCVTQDGFPIRKEADLFFAGCEVGWRNTFAGIRRHLEANSGRA